MRFTTVRVCTCRLAAAAPSGVRSTPGEGSHVDLVGVRRDLALAREAIDLEENADMASSSRPAQPLAEFNNGEAICDPAHSTGCAPM